MGAFHMDHVAILTASIEETAAGLGIQVEPAAVEEFPSEGTRELYVGDADAPARLLLMQPIGAGPYADALAKRGSGLHHVAFGHPDPEGLAESISGSGWLVHPSSIRLMRDAGQIWLCRPGVHTLIEVNEGVRQYGGTPVVQRVSIATMDGLQSLIRALPIRGLDATAGKITQIRLLNREISLSGEVLGGG